MKLLVWIIAIAALVKPSIAANLTWDAGNTANGATIDPASGTWDTTSAVWNNGSSDVAWTAGNVAWFGGADGNYAISVGTAISAANIIFTNSGYVLSANSPQTISSTATGSGAVPNVQVASGKTGTISNNVTVNVTSSTAVLGAVVGSAGSRTLVVDDGGTLKHTGNGSFILVGNATVRVKTGGLLLAASTAGTQVTIGGGTAGTDLPMLSVEGGIFSNTVTGGPLGVGNNNSATLTITNGGMVAMAPNVSKPLLLGGSVASGGKTGTVNLDGGTLLVSQVTNGAAGNTAIFNFNGGVLKPNNSNNTATFLSGLDTANIRNGGAVFDNNGFAVTIAQPLVHSSIGGDNATDGGLISQGTGTNTLTGASTYNGPTVVKSGTLLVTTLSSGGGAYLVSNNATLGVQVVSAGASLTASALTLGTGAGDSLTNNFIIGANSSPSSPPLAIGGALALNGTVTVNVSGNSFAGPNVYPLISYGSFSGSGNFVAGTLPLVSDFVVTLTNDTTAKKFEMIVSPPPAAERWAVGNGAWDTSTYNWLPLTGGSATNYSEGALVAFDDSARGTSPITVTLANDRTPGTVTNNSTKNYILAGNYNISAPQLIKDGTSTLTLDNGSVNSFGNIQINNGILQVGSSDTGGSLGSSGIINNNGILQFNRTDNLTVTNVISGTGGIIQLGTGTVALTGASTYTGNTVINAGKLAVSTAGTGGGSYMVADGATLEVQVGAAGVSLNNNNLTLGASGSLTNVFSLGTFASTTVPAIKVNGTLALNGRVAVKVSGTGLAAGTYPLLSYASISGSGSFVLDSAPSVKTNAVILTNDIATSQLELIVIPVSSLTWDAGNTANGTTIDAGSGTWDANSGNLAWNDGTVNRPWVEGAAATFGGVDGAWSISLATNVSPQTLAFANDGYAISATAPQSITLGTGFGATPNCNIGSGKTATIGTNVTLQVGSVNNLIAGGVTGSPGGTLTINNGGTVQVTGTATLGLVGVGATISVKTGGVLKRTNGGSVLLGSAAGDNCTLSVDGGSVSLVGSGALHIGGNSTAATVAGSLNMNSGSFSMDAANTTVPMMLGVNAGNLGTNNLNGGTLSVNQIVKGNAGATAVLNFNGGTLRAVNGALATNFLSGLDAANVRYNGAILDNNGFNLTVGQALVHSTIPGDNATDGGLTSLGSGSLTLTNVCSYTGNTTINAGRLALTGSGAIGSSPNIIVAGGATLDVSSVAFALGSSQVLSNSTSTATLNGNVNASVGTISLNYSSGAPAFSITNGTLILSDSTGFKIHITDVLLTAGSYKLVATNTAGLVTGTLPPVAVSGAGVSAGATTSLQTVNGELYLVVSSPQKPVITGINISGTTLNLTATNGVAKNTCILWGSTNIALPLSQWIPVLTNAFDINGNLNLSTNIITPNVPQQFFILSQ